MQSNNQALINALTTFLAHTRFGYYAQVQRLILETRQFDVLAGKIEASGSRSTGALDAHFTKSEVSSLLVDSANHAIRVGKPADAAELLVLAGRFGSLFSLLNRELASYLNTTSSEGFAKRQ